MKRFVNTYNLIEGFHQYECAPDFCAHLRNKHRHLFEIRCLFEVTNNDREIEIIHQQEEIFLVLENEFNYPCEFGNSSCETIAEFLLTKFNRMVECTVLEDGYGGATLTR